MNLKRFLIKLCQDVLFGESVQMKLHTIHPEDQLGKPVNL